MKIPFLLPTDGKMHRFCISCHEQGVVQVKENGKKMYYCEACDMVNDRAIYFNEHISWINEDGVLWHESAGVFVRRADGKFLFFKRTEFPFVLTVPAGHVDRNEEPIAAASRELEEETGLTGELEQIGSADITGDSCSAGADDHRWHAYLLRVENGVDANIIEEGEAALWLTFYEAKRQGVAFVVNEIIDRFHNQLMR